MRWTARECATRCAPVKNATAASPHTTRSRPRPPPRRSSAASDPMMASGRPPASSAMCSALGSPRARPPAPRNEPARAITRGDPSPAPPPWPGRRAAHGRGSRIHQGPLDRVLRHADRLGARRIRAAPWWVPLAVAGRFPARGQQPRAFPSVTSGGAGLAGIAAHRCPARPPAAPMARSSSHLRSLLVRVRANDLPRSLTCSARGAARRPDGICARWSQRRAVLRSFAGGRRDPIPARVACERANCQDRLKVLT